VALCLVIGANGWLAMLNNSANAARAAGAGQPAV
jgi:hypothetical protein